MPLQEFAHCPFCGWHRSIIIHDDEPPCIANSSFTGKAAKPCGGIDDQCRVSLVNTTMVQHTCVACTSVLSLINTGRGACALGAHQKQMFVSEDEVWKKRREMDVTKLMHCSGAWAAEGERNLNVQCSSDICHHGMYLMQQAWAPLSST